LGAPASRGEREVLAVPSDELARLSANPFFPYLVERLEAVTRRDREARPVAPAIPVEPRP